MLYEVITAADDIGLGLDPGLLAPYLVLGGESGEKILTNTDSYQVGIEIGIDGFIHIIFTYPSFNIELGQIAGSCLAHFLVPAKTVMGGSPHVGVCGDHVLYGIFKWFCRKCRAKSKTANDGQDTQRVQVFGLV